MIISTLLAAGLAAGTPAIAPVAHMNCHPDPQKSFACKRADADAKAGLRKTAAARKCHPHPGKALPCAGRRDVDQKANEALASREGDSVYE